MMRIAGRGIDGTAKAIKTDNAGRLLSLSLDKYKTQITRQITFAGKKQGQVYDHPHMLKSVVNNVLAAPQDVKGLAAGEISQADYERIANDDGVSRNSVTSSAGRTQILYALFDVYNESILAQGVSNPLDIKETRSSVRKIKALVKANAFGANVDVQTFGLSVRAFNRITQVWEEVSTNNANSPTNTSFSLDPQNYIDDTGFVYIALIAQHFATSTISSGNTVDFLKLDLTFAGELQSNQKTNNAEESHLTTVAVAGGQSATLENIDVSDCEQFALSLSSRPTTSHSHKLTVTPIGIDGLPLDGESVVIEGNQITKLSERITVKSQRVNVKIANQSIASSTYTYTIKLLKYTGIASVVTQQSQGTINGEVKIVGRREADGVDGLAMSFVEDNNGLPVLRTVNAAPHAYDEQNNALIVKELVQPKYEIETIASIIAIAPGTNHKAGFASKGEDETWVLINSDRTNWTATANVGAWAHPDAGLHLASALYPRRESVSASSSNANLPLRSLLINAANDPSIVVDTFEKALSHKNVADNAVYIANNNASDPIVVTVRIMRVWR